MAQGERTDGGVKSYKRRAKTVAKSKDKGEGRKPTLRPYTNPWRDFDETASYASESINLRDLLSGLWATLQMSSKIMVGAVLAATAGHCGRPE